MPFHMSFLSITASFRSSRITSYALLVQVAHWVTANASGFTPFSQSDTHIERVCLSRPVFKITEISWSTKSQLYQGGTLLSMVSRAAACFVVSLDMLSRFLQLFTVQRNDFVGPNPTPPFWSLRLWAIASSDLFCDVVFNSSTSSILTISNQQRRL